MSAGLPTTPPVPAEPQPSASGFARQWATFTADLASLQSVLRHELEESWRAAGSILADQERVVTTGPSDWTAAGSGFATRRHQVGDAVLLEPLGRWERQRPLQRALLAIESYHRGVDDLVRRMPGALAVSGVEVLDGLGPLSEGAPLRRIASWRRAVKPLPVRAMVARTLRTLEPGQLAIEGRFAMALGRALQALRWNWDRAREDVDAEVAGQEGPPVAREVHPVARAHALEQEAQAALTELVAWFDAAPSQLARRLVRGAAWRRAPRSPGANRRRARHLEHWTSQLGSLESELRFERALDAAERQMLEVAERMCAALEVERQGLMAAIDQFIAWLSARLAASGADTPPRSAPDLVPAESRTAELAAGIREAIAALPPDLRLLRQLDAMPRRRLPWRSIEPARMASEAFDRVGRPRFSAVFVALQSEHVGLIQQIERARQVVEFGAGSRPGEAGADASVAREALENARSLLEVDRRATVGRLGAERSLVAEALAEVFLENRHLLQRSRLGVFTRLGGLGLRQTLVTSGVAAVTAFGEGLRLTGRAIWQLYRRFLITIEWISPDEAEPGEVVRRPYLPREFIMDPRERELPAIYRRLFRFEAVDDARFLVGRDREMAAFAEARALWEAERPVAILVVGERGSGKTSLVNCALQRPLADLDVVRGELSERLASAAGVRDFLTQLLGLSSDTLLEEGLASQRRVVVLEETERAFLREIGGFDGIRELQRLIAATSASTLWLLVTNQHAFRLLHAAVRLGDGFSHRIDAASASAAAIRQAILVRHNLSGLRLRFAPPPTDRSLLGRVRRALRRKVDPEEAFFTALARECAGVFRTAFELWLGQIDAVQAGTLAMKPMSVPDLGAVIRQLDRDDLFALLAIMQHGSLTAEEHARVFQWSAGASRAQLDDLLAREIIEPDPLRPGFRVRPGAIRVAREALHRRNLG